MIDPLSATASTLPTTQTSAVSALTQKTDTSTVAGRVDFQMQLAQMLSDILPKSVMGSDDEDGSSSSVSQSSNLMSTQIQMMLGAAQKTPASAFSALTDDTTSSAALPGSESVRQPQSGGLDVA